MMVTQPPLISITSKVFKSGNSQAVRIPASLRIDADEVNICQLPDGRLLIEPRKSNAPSRGQVLLSVLSEFDDEFVEQLESCRNDTLPIQEREGL